MKVTMSYKELISMLTDSDISKCVVNIISEMKSQSRLSSKVTVVITGYEYDLRKVKVLDKYQF